jgi:hypothetical protein
MRRLVFLYGTNPRPVKNRWFRRRDLFAMDWARVIARELPPDADPAAPPKT